MLNTGEETLERVPDEPVGKSRASSSGGSGALCLCVCVFARSCDEHLFASLTFMYAMISASTSCVVLLPKVVAT